MTPIGNFTAGPLAELPAAVIRSAMSRSIITFVDNQVVRDKS